MTAGIRDLKGKKLLAWKVTSTMKDKPKISMGGKENSISSRPFLEYEI